MTKKDYEMIAKIISETRRDAGRQNLSAYATLRNLSIRLGIEFKTDNEKFDSDRFLIACNIPDSL